MVIGFDCFSCGVSGCLCECDVILGLLWIVDRLLIWVLRYL